MSTFLNVEYTVCTRCNQSFILTNMAPPNRCLERGKMARSKNDRQNRNSVIRVRETRTGNIRTETFGRDVGTTNFAMSTDPRNNSTSLFINTPYGRFKLSGSEARTIYRLIRKHYSNTYKSL